MILNRPRALAAVFVAAFGLSGAHGAFVGQEPARWSVEVNSQYNVTPNLSYAPGNADAVLDLYVPIKASKSSPVPIVIYLHGGGWQGGVGLRSTSPLRFLPFLQMQLAVANVDFRNGLVHSVEDSRSALRWIAANAEKYGLDAKRIVLVGGSSGGHLALSTGILPPSSEGETVPPVAAVVNFYGVTNLEDMLDGANQRPFVTRWLRDLPDGKAIAHKLSPLNHVRAGLPPILTVHGNVDPVTPFDQALKLHKALDAANVPNRLVVVPFGRHGGFPLSEDLKVDAAIREFLKQHGILH